MDKISKIVKRDDGYHILGHDGKHLGGPYSHDYAVKRLKEIEMFKHMKPAVSWFVAAKVHDFSSTQVQLPGEMAKTLIEIGRSIPEKSIYEEIDEDGTRDMGRETDAHITVKFGLHADHADEVRKVIAGFGPIKAVLTKVGMFNNADKPYDVLKFDVESEDLQRLSALIGEACENSDSHPKYIPHATIAYLKSGEGAKYIHGTEWAKHAEALLCGKEMTFESIMFSDKERHKESISLSSGASVDSPRGASLVQAARDNSGIYIGVSGFNYKSWNGVFYPSDLPGKKRLEYYASKFNTLEVSSTYYQMPEPRVLAGWNAKTPPGFIFSFRAPKQVTHIRHLVDCGDIMAAFMDRLSVLGSKLGVVTFQLQESLPYDGAVLAAFLESLPKGFHYSMEFRSEPWHNEECYALLAAHNVSLVTVSHSNKSIHAKQPAEWGYFRMSGHNPDYRKNCYSDADLRNWQGIISESARPAFVYFNNEYAAYSAKNAATLASIMGLSVKSSPGYVSPVSDGPSNPTVGPNNGPSTSAGDPEDNAPADGGGENSRDPWAKKRPLFYFPTQEFNT